MEAVPPPLHLQPQAAAPTAPALSACVAGAAYLRHVDAPDVVANLGGSQLLQPVRWLVLQSGPRDGPDGRGPKRHLGAQPSPHSSAELWMTNCMRTVLPTMLLGWVSLKTPESETPPRGDPVKAKRGRSQVSGPEPEAPSICPSLAFPCGEGPASIPIRSPEGLGKSLHNQVRLCPHQEQMLPTSSASATANSNPPIVGRQKGSGCSSSP